ncbi:sre G protein-coupled chemoreceptor domain-containing protein [Ditylenchus destructor]|uniref:Sre G protein-coupled chemoreceptor domain-containing protein n=1 Tax=Ditylenchus destructor TaxID=166010 RepID=A0AAD4RBF2_9BILA|nr:sre G protein-coupled chemoreceptor domain-containing protein [Ditylenchus destructor]
MTEYGNTTDDLDNDCTSRFPIIPVDRIAEELKSIHLPYFTALVILEVIVLVLGVLIKLIAIFIFFKHPAVLHVNWRRIAANILLQYLLFHLVTRLIEIGLMCYYFFKCGEGINTITVAANALNLKESPFYWTNTIRIYFIMVGAFTLPASAIERICATVLVSDYEANTRSFISTLLIVVINITSIAYTAIYQNGWWSKQVLLATIVVGNMGAVIVAIYCDRQNIRFYSRNLQQNNRQQGGAGSKYSLSERYQCAENIRIAKILRKLFVLAAVFVMILAGVFALRLIGSENIVPKCLNYEIFDLGIGIAAGAISLLVLRDMCFLWFNDNGSQVICCGKERKSLEHSSGVVHPSSQDGRRMPPPQLHNVLGVPLLYQSPKAETEVYFGQLEQMWQTPKPNKV